MCNMVKNEKKNKKGKRKFGPDVAPLPLTRVSSSLIESIRRKEQKKSEKKTS